MQLYNMNFERIRVHVFPKRSVVMDNALHLNRAFESTRRAYRLRLQRSKSGEPEFIFFVAVALLQLFLRNWVFAGGKCEQIDLRHEFLGRKINDAFARANQIV
jgi:hypothetical protein